MPVHRTRRRVTVRGALALLVGVLVLTACDPPFPSDDDFYDPPDPLPAGAPGDLVDQRDTRFTLDPVNKEPVPGVSSWDVVYRSTDALGEPTPVTGTVLVPDDAWDGPGSRPLVSWAVGTRGLGDDCAPSYTLSQGADYEGLFIEAALAKGWAVAVSDYQGLGTPGIHTYMVGPAQGHAVLDMARAAQNLPEAGLDPSGPVGLMGYSQGGSGAGWAAELAASYAPGLNVVGTAAGGVPADLTETAEFLDGSPFVALALMAALGLDGAYPELDLDSYLNARGQELVQTSQDLCLVDVDGFTALVDTAFSDIDDYTTTNPLDTAPWQARLDEIRLGDTAPNAPVYQYHGVVDEIVPYGQARQLRRDWCDEGATVTWSTLPGEHVLGMAEGLPLALAWMEARFAGLPTWGNCPWF
ncbi:MAG: lipase family protein [Acidimicrobiia bacterium]|nr:lipase family protein [Acidimicrobiia bacterium]